MTNLPRILIVEDEPIIAMDIAATLEKLGYQVIDRVQTGEDAIERALQHKPDLILMDIHLATAMDGVEAAEIIKAKQRTPVVFLTAYSDDETLERAKLTEPFGYAVKPFQERELHILIQVALHKSMLETKLRKSEETLRAVLRHMTDAVLLTDATGQVEFLNEHAMRLTGTDAATATRENVRQVLDITMGQVDELFKDSLLSAIRAGEEKRISGGHVRVRDRLGGITRVEGVLVPMKGENDQVLGAVLVLRDHTHADRMDELVREVDHLKELMPDRIRELV